MSKKHKGRKHGKHAAAPAYSWAAKPVDLAKKYADHPRYYVGYGSNHNVVQMQARCATAMPLAGGMLPGQRLVFARVLTVEPCEGRSTPVSIWRVEPADIAALDRYEGFPRMYSKRYAHATVKGERVATFYYVLNPPYTETPPPPHYYETCAEGYSDWGFDLAYLETSREEARAVHAARATEYACELCGEHFGGGEVVTVTEATYACLDCFLKLGVGEEVDAPYYADE